MEQNEKGKLYIVATPIGNSRDMSPRGREILSTVDIIAAEDTRRSMVLLNKLEIRNRLVSNHKFNEYGKARFFVDEMLAGKSVAVITDAGTPCISDPGNELIRAAVEAGIDVVRAAVRPLRRCPCRALICPVFFSAASSRGRTRNGEKCWKNCGAAIRAPLFFTRAPSASWSWWISSSAAKPA